jgi:hypothetical protein
MRNRSEHMASEEPPGEYDREDFRPSSIGRTRSGLREPRRPETSFEPAERDTKKSQTRMVLESGHAIRSMQSLYDVAGSRPSTIRFIKAALWSSRR